MNITDASINERQLKEVAAKILALGPSLPKFLSQLEMWQRGALVSAMCMYVDIPAEVVGVLIVEPEAVSVSFVPPDDDESVLNDAIYATADALAERGYDVGPSLGVVGMDWPRGSGDYHGGAPLPENATPEEVEERHRAFCSVIGDLQKK